MGWVGACVCEQGRAHDGASCAKARQLHVHEARGHPGFTPCSRGQLHYQRAPARRPGTMTGCAPSSSWPVRGRCRPAPGRPDRPRGRARAAAHRGPASPCCAGAARAGGQTDGGLGGVPSYEQRTGPLRGRQGGWGPAWQMAKQGGHHFDGRDRSGSTGAGPGYIAPSASKKSETLPVRAPSQCWVGTARRAGESI